MYGGEDEGNQMNQLDSPKSTISRKSRLTQTSGRADSIEEIPDPLVDRAKYLERLSVLQNKALHVRMEEDRFEKVRDLIKQRTFSIDGRSNSLFLTPLLSLRNSWRICP